MRLSDSIVTLPKTSAVTFKKMKSVGINTLYQLLLLKPNRYEDFSAIVRSQELQDGLVGTCRGEVVAVQNVYTRSRITIQRVTIKDAAGTITVQFFNQPYVLRTIRKGNVLSCAGRIKKFGAHYFFIPDTFELGEPAIHTGRILPIYPELRGMSNRLLREKIDMALTLVDSIDEYLPRLIVETYNLSTLRQALVDLHRPKTFAALEQAKNRFAFDELLRIQIAVARIRREWASQTDGHTCNLNVENKKLFDRFMTDLPFMLTDDQITAIQDITGDMTSGKPMNRFLQGDVGSGKTIVAIAAAYYVFLCGKRVLYMAPTEILAKQQFESFKAFLGKYNVKVGLLTGSNKNKNNGAFDIIVGTHALLSSLEKQNDYILVIIDEQHRFGVKQRALLKSKGNKPHLLTMTATPIPRTVALTLFGDLDMSVISSSPAGRKKVKTYVVNESKRQDAYAWIQKQILEEHKQAFIVCPLIEGSESETLQSVKSVKIEFERLQANVFPNLHLVLLHGKMKSDEKMRALDEFATGKAHILVSTSVIEVGIDIPNATIMCIEGAERFGLAQLHQLRGRVGRSSYQSHCLLFPTHESSDRLSYFVQNTNGMKLAEYDLASRGPGSLYGFEQHGYLDLTFSTLSDATMIHQTKKAANYILETWSDSDYPEFYSSVLLKEKELVAKD